MPKATLVNGQDYYLGNYHFKKDVPVEVDKETAEYLKENEQFEVEVKTTKK